MSALLFLVATLLSGHAKLVDYDQPTGDLERGDILVERGAPSTAACDHRGAITVTVGGVRYCVGGDY